MARNTRDDGRPPADDRELLVLYCSLRRVRALGLARPTRGLYSLLYKVVPVFSLLRAPGRTGLIVALILALFAAFGVRTLRRQFSGRASTVVAASCSAAALLELTGVPIDWREAKPISPVYDVLARMPRGPVAEFPLYERRIDFHLHTIYMVNSTRHWQPLLNGYSDYIPGDFRTLAVTLASFPSAESFEALKQRRARYLVVHRDLYGGQTAPQIEARLRPLPALLARGRGGRTRADLRDHGLAEHEVNGQAPFAPGDRALSRASRLASWPEPSWAALSWQAPSWRCSPSPVLSSPRQ